MNFFEKFLKDLASDDPDVKNNAIFKLVAAVVIFCLVAYNAYDWDDITTLQGAGNTALSNYYEFEDADYERGHDKIYYRLKQVDFDGKARMSQITSVAINSSDIVLDIYPNPAKDIVHIESNLKNVDLKLFNVSGQPISLSKCMESVSEHHWIIRCNLLTPGYYMVQIGDKRKAIKIL